MAEGDELPSTRLARLLNSLPGPIRKQILNEHLLPLVDTLPSSESTSLISTATGLHERYRACPRLDIRQKRIEVDGLVDYLAKNIKRDAGEDRREDQAEIMAEIAFSLSAWLQDIWSCVVEYAVDFDLAHDCLNFSMTSLARVRNSGASCKCAFLNMDILIVIRSNSGSLVKSWEFTGGHKLEEAIIWMWRELFLSLLATGREEDLKEMPRLLNELERHGWTTIELIWYGGLLPEESRDDDYHPDEDDEEDEDDYTDTSDDYSSGPPSLRSLSDSSSPGSSGSASSKGGRSKTKETSGLPSDKAPEPHWTPRMLSSLPVLRTQLTSTLTSIFNITPSYSLYNALLSLSSSPSIKQTLIQTLIEQAPYNPTAASVGLRLAVTDSDIPTLLSVINNAANQLGDSDATMFQAAIHIISHYPAHRSLAVSILSNQLRSSLRAIETELSIPFPYITSPDRKEAIAEIIRLPKATPDKKKKITEWVKSVTASPVSGANGVPPNPMQFAAMLMGFPPPNFGGDDDDEDGVDGMDRIDPLANMVVGPEDDEYRHIMDCHRPLLKQRWEGWVYATRSLDEEGIPGSNGKKILYTVYKELCERMPWIRSNEATNQMIDRISDKKSAIHTCEALESLASFYKTESARHKKAAAKNAKAQAAPGSSSSKSPSNGGRSTAPSDQTRANSKSFIGATMDVD